MSPPLAQKLFAALADGAVHSGQDLASALGVSRGGVWKAIESLRGMGLELQATPKRGYRLQSPVVPLQAESIRAALSEPARAGLRHCEVAWQLGSTNAELLARQDLPLDRGDALLAEYQSAGRGRRGRQWLAPPGGALCLSLSWNFPALPNEASALSLAVGVWVRRALLASGVHQVGLKWPNDLQVHGAKLGGILIELRGESLGPALVVIGVGLNVAMSEELRAAIRASGNEPVDLQRLGLAHCDRNVLAARLLDEALRGLPEFERSGLAPWRAEWQQADVLKDRAVQVMGAAGEVRGIARGIDAEGVLLIETAAGLQKIMAGEVSVRAQT
ncbi:MAG: biotin--[acetyl-CoA-carboxylase] ligase [Steroidobacteraceae bacterium]